ncbi:hypothetical protein GJ496_011434 [Pomphorhynchus laevis]|nr:hypothetical protein GJ496_011434 [Pomphorhynchus laevis]
MDPQKCDYDIYAYKYMIDQKLHKLSWMLGRQVSAEELNYYEPCARRTFHRKQSQSNNSCSNLSTTNEYAKKAFINLADVDLSKSEVAVSNLGLNFNITPREYIARLPNYRNACNLSKDEWDAITSLRNRCDIVISKADKGPEAVLWKKSDYNEEALRQLQTQAYKVASKDDFIESIQQVNDLIDEFVMKRVSSYVRNTYDFVGKVTKMSLNENDILCTMDVEGLYSNIPIVKGINSVHYAMQEASIPIVKGINSGAVLWDWEDYQIEAMKQLNTNSHESVDQQDFIAAIKYVEESITEVFPEEKLRAKMIVRRPRPGRFSGF